MIRCPATRPSNANRYYQRACEDRAAERELGLRAARGRDLIRIGRALILLDGSF